MTADGAGPPADTRSGFKRYRHAFRMQLLVRSRLMVMAANLANLFTGLSVIDTHAEVAAWEDACAGEVPGFRRPRRD